MARMRRMGRQQGDTPTRQPIDMAPDFRAGPYRPLPITPDYERPMPMPLPIPRADPVIIAVWFLKRSIFAPIWQVNYLKDK